MVCLKEQFLDVPLSMQPSDLMGTLFTCCKAHLSSHSLFWIKEIQKFTWQCLSNASFWACAWQFALHSCILRAMSGGVRTQAQIVFLDRKWPYCSLLSLHHSVIDIFSKHVQEMLDISFFLPDWVSGTPFFGSQANQSKSDLLSLGLDWRRTWYTLAILPSY